MAQFSRETSVLLGVTPPLPGEGSLPSRTKVKRLKKRSYHIYRRQEDLTEEQKKKVVDTLDKCYREWLTNTSLLRSKLARINSIMEGIKDPKTFPWPDCSNLHIPVIEIHVTILHSVVSSTMLENDPIWYVKIMLDGMPEGVDTEIESFLNATSKVNLKIDSVLSDIYWNAYRDGTSIGDVDWVEEYDWQYDIKVFSDPDEFVSMFPSPKEAGITPDQYTKYIREILEEGECHIKIEELMCTYRGPRLRLVELKDFVMIPTTAPTMDYAMFVGDMFLQRGDYFKRLVQQEWFDEDETLKMLNGKTTDQAVDDVTRTQDSIEGLARTRITEDDEFWAMQGVLKINLSDNKMLPDKKYLVVFHPASRALLRFECYPYIHNRMKYIDWRFKKRPGRFLGQSIYEQLIDINEEVDTQHNQRVDSRTITTVPSFLRVDGFEFDPTKKGQKFYPGVMFRVSNFNQIKQFVIAQTDMGQSMQEEQNLMYVAELRTGATSLRGGQGIKADPRAPFKKVQAQLQQSDIRIDDHMRELRIGTAEVGLQILELYYQCAPEVITFYKQDPNTLAFIQMQISRQKLRARNLFLEVARTSVNDNPAMKFQMELTKYQLLSNEPLVGSNMIRRRELLIRLLTSMRERNIEKLIPPVKQLLEELGQQDQMMGDLAPETIKMLGIALASKTGADMNNAGPGTKKPFDTSGSTPLVEG